MAFRINLTTLVSSAFLIWNRDLLVKHCFDCTSHIASPALLDGCYFSHQDKARQGKTRQDKTRQDKARQDKAIWGNTRQHEKRQDKARQIYFSHQDKTGQEQVDYDSPSRDSTGWCRWEKERAQDRALPPGSCPRLANHNMCRSSYSEAFFILFQWNTCKMKKGKRGFLTQQVSCTPQAVFLCTYNTNRTSHLSVDQSKDFSLW